MNLTVTPKSESEIAVRYGQEPAKTMALSDTLKVNGGYVTFAPNWNYGAQFFGKEISINRIPALAEAKRILSRLNVYQLSTDNKSLLGLHITDVNNDRACDILMTLIDTYNDFTIREKNELVALTDEFIQERINAVARDLGRLIVDTKVHSRKEIEENCDMPFLGEIPEFKPGKKGAGKDGKEGRLFYNGGNSGLLTESFRMLCNNIEMMRPVTARTVQEAEETLPYLPGLASMNLRYIIVGDEVPPIRYRHAKGNAWFEADSLGHIELVSYAPNELKYRYESSEGGKAVFSEVYYPAGWSLKNESGEDLAIEAHDGILRSAVLPAGSHELVMRFAPASYAKGEKLSRACSIAIILLVLLSVAFKVNYAVKI